MFNPKVSIIIPVYNWGNYLIEAIESALNQSYNNIEIIVINDWSNDNWITENIAKSYWDKIKYIKKENWWVSSALNTWIKNMTWEYFSWLSHDDLYFPNKIEAQITFLSKIKNRDSVIVNSDYCHIDNNWKILKEIMLNKLVENSDIIDLILNKKYPIYWCSLLIKKDIFEKIWLFNLKLKCTQDYDMWLRILNSNFEIKHLSKVLSKYRRHDTHWNSPLWLLWRFCQKEEFYLYNKFLTEFWKKYNFDYLKILKLRIHYLKSFLIFIFSDFLVCLSKKFKIHSYLSPIWRKYILRRK